MNLEDIMKKMKLFALCMASVLALSAALTGCGNGGSSSKPAGSSSDGSGSSTAPIDVSITTVDFGQSPDGTPIQEEWEQLMAEKLGKPINFTWYRYASGDYPEKIQTVVSSGEITDIVTYFNNGVDAITYGEKGMFVDLSKYTDLTPNYNAVLAADPDAKTKVYSDDSLYAFYLAMRCSVTYNHLWNYTGTMYKGKVFEENGLEFPSTLDGVYQAAKTLKEKGVSEYPIILHEEWQYPDDVVMAAYHTNTSNFWDGEKYAYGPLSEDYLSALKWLNKIYTEGLISPDYFTQTQENGSAALSNGTACIVLSAWEGYSSQYANPDKYPEDKWTMSAIPASDKYPDTPWQFSTLYREGWLVYAHNNFAISAKSPNVEDLIRLGDFQYEDDVVDLLNWGRKDIDYTVDANGEKISSYNLQDPDSAEAFAATGNPMSGVCRSAIFPQTSDIDFQQKVTNYPGPFVYNGQLVNESYTAYADQFATEKTIAANDTDPRVALNASEQESFSNIMSPIKTYEAEQRAAFIKGARSLDEFDAFVAELNAMGDIQAALDLYNSKLK